MRAGIRKLADAIGGGLFVAMFLVFLVQIVARFAFNRPLPWTDEAAVVLYVWVILWSAAFIVPEREHVVFDLLWNGAGLRGRQVMRVLGNAMVGVLAALAIPASWDYVRFMGRESTPVLDVPFSWVFLPFVALLFALVVRCAWNVWQALRGQGLQADALGAQAAAELPQ